VPVGLDWSKLNSQILDNRLGYSGYVAATTSVVELGYDESC
jgi:hypothetical protein